MSPERSWQRNAPPDLAAERILDAAGRCFARLGVTAATIGDVAREAGCSRPTIYRYFPDREALRRGFVDREAEVLGARVAAAVAGIADPQEQVVVAVLAALDGVRTNAILAAWFTPSGVATATSLARSSTVIERLATAMVDGDDDDEQQRRARWLVRVIVSLLAMPGEDPAEERLLIEQYVAPLVAPSGRRRVRSPRTA